jgi:hypothetical protein
LEAQGFTKKSNLMTNSRKNIMLPQSPSIRKSINSTLNFQGLNVKTSKDAVRSPFYPPSKNSLISMRKLREGDSQISSSVYSKSNRTILSGKKSHHIKKSASKFKNDKHPNTDKF